MSQNRSEELKDRPIGELLKQLSQETAALVRQEIELAKAEVTQKGKAAGVAAGLFGGAGAIGLGAFGAFTAFLVLLLALALPAWASALIVTVVYGAIAAVLALRGKRKMQEASPPVPQQTVETVKEDIEWAKTQRKSDTR